MGLEYANAPPVAVAPLSGMPLCGMIHRLAINSLKCCEKASESLNSIQYQMIYNPSFQAGVQKQITTNRALAQKRNMSYVKIWVHTVWGTKYNQPILTKEVRTTLYDHILENAKDKKIYTPLDDLNK